MLYPKQDIGESESKLNPEIKWIAINISTRDRRLSMSASKKIKDQEALLPELGPATLDKHLPTYPWHDTSHLRLEELWEWLNRYPYLPCPKDEQVLVDAIRAAIARENPGPFAHTESWDEEANTYRRLIFDHTPNAQIAINKDSVLVRPEVVEKHRPKKEGPTSAPSSDSADPPEDAAQVSGHNA